jgi:hypothetical protein
VRSWMSWMTPLKHTKLRCGSLHFLWSSCAFSSRWQKQSVPLYRMFCAGCSVALRSSGQFTSCLIKGVRDE